MSSHVHLFELLFDIVSVLLCFSFYSELLTSGVLQPLHGAIEGLRQNHDYTNYVTPLGMSSVVKHFLSQSGRHSPVHMEALSVTVIK